MVDFAQVSLSTSRLVLRQFRVEDAAGVFAMFTDAAYMEYVAFPHFKSMEEAHALVARDMKAMAAGERIRLGLERVADGALIGNCTLFNLDADCRSAELGYGLLGHACGKGYMHEALSALLAFGFETLHLNRVQAEINPKNVNSARSLQRMGFVQEGVLRENCMEHGVLHDSAFYGLLRREWKGDASHR